jgi:hypothetical protein
MVSYRHIKLTSFSNFVLDKLVMAQLVTKFPASSKIPRFIVLSKYGASVAYHEPTESVKGKDIPVTGHGGPYGCERLRLPHYLDKR